MSCSGNCNSCSTTCASDSRKSMLEPQNQFSNVKKVIGVVSGKGGVGKSLTTSYLSVLMNRKGYKTAILDADITGPSIPKTFGIHQKAMANELGMIPAESQQGIKVMSVNLLLEEEEMPVVWRGPVIASTVKQFWKDVLWEDVDYMFVDMPPGTGDVPLTVFQSIPVDGIIIVTSPQDLVSMIVGKAVNMAKAMNIPIIGLVENYSYIACGNCGEHISVFGESHVEQVGEKYGLKVLDKVPIDPAIAKAVDAGKIEELNVEYYANTADWIESSYPVEKKQVAQKQCIAVPVLENNDIDRHFGKAKAFQIYTFDAGQLTEQKLVESEGTGHQQAADLLVKQGVNVVLCGGIGLEAMNLLLENKIGVYPGMQGDANVAVSSYMDGAVSQE